MATEDELRLERLSTDFLRFESFEARKAWFVKRRKLRKLPPFFA